MPPAGSSPKKNLSMSGRERHQLRILAVLSLVEDLSPDLLSSSFLSSGSSLRSESSSSLSSESSSSVFENGFSSEKTPKTSDSKGSGLSNFEEFPVLPDFPAKDITSSSIFPRGMHAAAFFVAQEPIVVSCIDVVPIVFSLLDPSVKVETLVPDGDFVETGTRMARVEGNIVSILAAERAILNFLQRCSGIATLASRYVSVASRFGVKIYDTRKTVPAWRFVEKYAARCGGAMNHRAGLHDQILVKSTHIDAAGGIREALSRVFSRRWVFSRHPNSSRSPVRVEVEVRNLEELDSALSFPIDIVLLDNMPVETARKAVSIVRNLKGKTSPEVEISGGISLSNLKEYCFLHPDRISVGAITHSAPAAKIHMEIFMSSSSSVSPPS